MTIAKSINYVLYVILFFVLILYLSAFRDKEITAPEVELFYIPIPDIYVDISQPRTVSMESTTMESVIDTGETEDGEPSLVVEVSRISAYNAVPRQTDGDPTISSCGPNLERQVAVSRDLFFDEFGTKHLCGKTVTVLTERGEVFEDYVIWDTMSERFTKTVDILLPTLDESVAFSFGVTSGVLYFYD